MATPLFQAKATAVATITTSLAITAPAANLDDLFLAVVYSNNNTAPTAPAGWAQITAGNNTVTMNYSVFWKRVGPGDSGASFTFTVAGTTVSFGTILSYRGATPGGNPIGNISRSDNASSSTITWATLTPQFKSSLIVLVGAYALNGTVAGAVTGTNPTFTSNELDNTATGATAGLVEYDGPNLIVTAMGSRTDATTATAAVNTGVAIEILGPTENTGSGSGSTPGATNSGGYSFVSRLQTRPDINGLR